MTRAFFKVLRWLPCLLFALAATSAFAHCRPENRVWGFSEKPSNFASQETAKPIDTPGENPDCGYDFASGVHNYLYCQADPLDRVDPSGHDGDLMSLSISSSIGASMDAMYNGGVVTVYNSMKATIMGVKENMSSQQILTGYLTDVAVGVGVGVTIGVAAQLSEDLIYGTSAARSCCFTAGTPVAMECGEKPIEQIRPDDLVWSWDEGTGEFKLEKVVSTHVRQVNEEVIVQTSDDTITATPTHPFRVKGKGWVEAGDLRIGDSLITLNDQTETVTGTVPTNFPTFVFNFEVGNTHTYLVGAEPVVVHNACAWATRSASIPEEPGIYVIRSSTGARYVGKADNLSVRLTRGNHSYQSLIEDPNSEVFTMSLDVSQIKSTEREALFAVEEFWIRALGARGLGLNKGTPMSQQKLADYIQKYGLPQLGPPVPH